MPSSYSYDLGRIKESRFSDRKGWYAPSDDLVADDAAAGTPVATVGWWEESRSVFQVGARVYYVADEECIRERANQSYFDETGTKDDFNAELPKPDEFVQPRPDELVLPVFGWKSTPIDKTKNQVQGPSMPKVIPLRTTKLAAVRSEDESIHVIYQAKDTSIRELVYSPSKGWNDPVAETNVVFEAGTVKSGTPLTTLLEAYSDERIKWFAYRSRFRAPWLIRDNRRLTARLPPATTPYTLLPSAMISAVANNFATPFFEMRIYTAVGNDDLHERSFHRRGGWRPSHQAISAVETEALPEVTAPLSAVAAVLVPGDWVTKVYFHPRRIIIAEWDISAKEAAHAGITKLSAAAKARPAVEEETWANIVKRVREGKKICQWGNEYKYVEEEKVWCCYKDGEASHGLHFIRDPD
ncbi:hypothetical protein VTI74DRAFT_7312 [Chaetomium olivicolor]